MHLFGLNWQLQQTENDTFENGKVNSDTVPTHPVTVPAGENGKWNKHQFLSFFWSISFLYVLFTSLFLQNSVYLMKAQSICNITFK